MALCCGSGKKAVFDANLQLVTTPPKYTDSPRPRTNQTLSPAPFHPYLETPAEGLTAATAAFRLLVISTHSRYGFRKANSTTNVTARMVTRNTKRALLPSSSLSTPAKVIVYAVGAGQGWGAYIDELRAD